MSKRIARGDSAEGSESDQDEEAMEMNPDHDRPESEKGFVLSNGAGESQRYWMKEACVRHDQRFPGRDVDESKHQAREISPDNDQGMSDRAVDNLQYNTGQAPPESDQIYPCHNRDNDPRLERREVSPENDQRYPGDEKDNPRLESRRKVSHQNDQRYPSCERDGPRLEKREVSPQNYQRYPCQKRDNPRLERREMSHQNDQIYPSYKKENSHLETREDYAQNYQRCPSYKRETPRLETGEVFTIYNQRCPSQDRESMHEDLPSRWQSGSFLSYLRSRYWADDMISPALEYQRDVEDNSRIVSRNRVAGTFPGPQHQHHIENNPESRSDGIFHEFDDLNRISSELMPWYQRQFREMDYSNQDSPAPLYYDNYSFYLDSRYGADETSLNGDQQVPIDFELVSRWQNCGNSADPPPPSYDEVFRNRRMNGARNVDRLNSYDSEEETNIDGDESDGSEASPLDQLNPPVPRDQGAAPGDEDNDLHPDEEKSLAKTRLMARHLRRGSGSTIAREESVELEMMDIGTSETEEEPEESQKPRPSPIRRRSYQLDGDLETSIDGHTSELGQAPQRSRESVASESYECTVFPILTPAYSYIRKALDRASTTKKILILVGVFVVLGLLLLVSLFPASFVYVNYDEIGFSRNKVTGAHDYSQVYDVGCYLLAPQDEIVTFNSTAHILALDLYVMNSEGMSIGLSVSLQYFIRPEELHELFSKYYFNYPDIISRVTESTVKNSAIDFSLDEYRLNRSFVEKGLFQKVRQAVSGDCCAPCCPVCSDGKTKCGPGDCKTFNCSQGYHVDVPYFQLGRISIPESVMNRYLTRVILQIEAEKEKHIQDAAVQRKETEYKVQLEYNAANEIRRAAEADAHLARIKAEASYERDTQLAYIKSLKKTFSRLNMTTEESKTAFMYLKALKDVSHNLYAFSYAYDKNTLNTP